MTLPFPWRKKTSCIKDDRDRDFMEGFLMIKIVIYFPLLWNTGAQTDCSAFEYIQSCKNTKKKYKKE
jgi:hypothetical protein